MLEKECSEARTCVEAYLPSYDEAMKVNEYQDLMRLPTYQFRHVRHYHPYLRFVSHDELKSTRYFNTIYDDETVDLEIPSEFCQQIPSNPAVTADEDARNQRPISQDGPPHSPNTSEGNRDLERLMQRLSSVVAVFAAAVKRANGIYEAECRSAIENTSNTSNPDPSLQSTASSS